MNDRELKFRVWDSQLKKFKTTGSTLHDLGPCYELWFDEKREIYIIQQYTGLKDKDGEEIYEGDIFKFTRTYVGKSYKNYDYKNPILSDPKTDVEVGVVVFDKINDVDDFYTPTMLAWGIKNGDRISSLCGKLEEYNSDNLHDSTYGKTISQSVDLVGNIFENPELLK